MISKNRIAKIEKKLGVDGSINLTEIFMWILDKNRKKDDLPPPHIARWFEIIAEKEREKENKNNENAVPIH